MINEKLLPSLQGILANKPNHPSMRLNYKSMGEYLRSRDVLKLEPEYSVSLTAATVANIHGSGTEAFAWVYEFIVQLRRGTFVRPRLDKYRYESLMLLREVCLDVEHLCQNLTTAEIKNYYLSCIESLLNKCLYAISNKDDSAFWDVEGIAETFITQSIRNACITRHELAPFKSKLEIFYKYKDAVWAHSFENRLKPGKLIDFADERYYVETELMEDIYQCKPYISYVLSKFFVYGSYDTAIDWLKQYYTDKGWNTKQLMDHVNLNMVEFNNISYSNNYSSILQLLLIWRTSGYKYLYPLNASNRNTILNSTSVVINYTEKENLKWIYLDSFLEGYIDVDKGTQVYTALATSMLDEMRVNIETFYALDLISKEDRENYIKKGWVKYGG